MHTSQNLSRIRLSGLHSLEVGRRGNKVAKATIRGAFGVMKRLPGCDLFYGFGFCLGSICRSMGVSWLSNHILVLLTLSLNGNQKDFYWVYWSSVLAFAVWAKFLGIHALISTWPETYLSTYADKPPVGSHRHILRKARSRPIGLWLWLIIRNSTIRRSKIAFNRMHSKRSRKSAENLFHYYACCIW